jgi:hypothetical protein
MAEARQDKQHSVWPSLIKNLARRVVNGLIDWLLGLAVAALLAAAFFLKANWRIVVASVMVCLALSILALARWTRHAADRAHSRTPSNQQLITWYWITIGIQLASLLPGVVAVYFLGRRALPLWLFLGLFVIIDVAINTLWGVRYPNQPIRPGEPPFRGPRSTQEISGGYG